MKNVIISDVTLKALAQQQKELTFREKLSVAKNLQKIGVDVIELPACHNKKEEVVVNKTIAESVGKTTVAIDCGLTNEEIEFAFDSIKDAKNKRLQVVLPLSVVALEYLYHIKIQNVNAKIEQAVKTASNFTEVEFIAKDVTRAEKDVIISAVKTAIESGAKIITLCDDLGEGFDNVFSGLIKEIKAISDVKVLVCPSDKIKMSPSIAVESILSGADGVKTSTVGEYLSLITFADIVRFKGEEMGVKSNIDYTLIKETVKELTSSYKADFEKVGFSKTSTISDSVTIKEMGDLAKNLGYELSTEDVGKVYEEFKRVCSKKGSIGERELEAIIASSAMQVPSTYHLISYVVNSGNIISATANVILEKEGVQTAGVSTGDGPIDASFQAIEQIIGHHYELDDLNVQAVTKGREAVGSAIVRLRANGKIYSGNGVSTDIVGACIRAYVNALNKIVYNQN